MQLKIEIPFAESHISLFVYDIPVWFTWVIVIFALLGCVARWNLLNI